jgi:hypothetical protein
MRINAVERNTTQSTQELEYNAQIVSAYSSKFGGSGVDIGYELIQRVRTIGTRKWSKWEIVGKTQNWQEASDWAARSDYIIRKPRA